MTKAIQILSGVFVLQLAAFAYFSSKEDPTGVYKNNEPLVSVDFETLDRVVMEDGENKSVSLKKVSGAWTIEESFDFPANPAKVKEFFSSLGKLKKSWPVAKTSSAAKKFFTTEEKFERRVTFYKGGEPVNVLFVGTSPGFRKVHVQTKGDKNVYSVEYNSYDVPVKVADWYDKNYYKVAKDSVSQLDVQGVVLTQTSGAFQVSDMDAAKEESNTSKVKGLVTTMLNPDFEEVMSKDQAPVGSEGSLLSYTVKKSNGDEVGFSFKELKAEKAEDAKNFAVLKISTHPFFFKIRKSRIEDLILLKREDVVKAKEASTESDLDPSQTLGQAAEINSDSVKK